MRAKFVIAALVACGFSLVPVAVGQTQSSSAERPPAPVYAAPRTSFGQPSLEGVWTHNFLLILETPPGVSTLVVTDTEAKAITEKVANGIAAQFEKGLDPEIPALIKSTDGLPIVRGQRRTRTVVEPADGKVPYTPDARKESGQRPTAKTDTYEERPYWERCITSLGLPPITGIGSTEANPRRIVQVPGYIVVHTEYGDEARIIPLTDTHGPQGVHTRLGDAIARWEDETLIIETIGMLAKERIRTVSNLIVSPESKVIERYTRLSENELLYQYTVEDPSIYTAPWLAEYSLYRTDQRMFEHACHEGNYAVSNILQSARVADARAATEPSH